MNNPAMTIGILHFQRTLRSTVSDTEVNSTMNKPVSNYTADLADTITINNQESLSKFPINKSS